MHYRTPAAAQRQCSPHRSLGCSPGLSTAAQLHRSRATLFSQITYHRHVIKLWRGFRVYLRDFPSMRMSSTAAATLTFPVMCHSCRCPSCTCRPPDPHPCHTGRIVAPRRRLRLIIASLPTTSPDSEVHCRTRTPICPGTAWLIRCVITTVVSLLSPTMSRRQSVATQ